MQRQMKLKVLFYVKKLILLLINDLINKYLLI